MSLGKMSRWLAVRRGSSTKEDVRTRRTQSQKQRLQRHHSEGDIVIGDLELKKGDMQIMQLRESPGVARRAFPSPVGTPSPDKTSDVQPASSHPSLAPPPCDQTLDSIDDSEFAEPGYALPSMCSRSNLHANQPRTSTPLNGRLGNGVGTSTTAGVGPSTPAETPSPASTMSTSEKPSRALVVQEKKEAVEDLAGGYDVVCLDTVRQVSASLPRMMSDTSVVHESVSTGPIHREDYVRKLGRRFKSWKKRWVCLQPTELSFFKTVDVTAPSRTIMTGDVMDVFYPATVPFPGGHSFEVVTVKRTHILAAKTESGARAWVHLIQRASGRTRRQGSGRSSAQSDSVNPADIEPYAQAVVPVRRRARQAAEPTYAIASRTTPTRKELDGGGSETQADNRKDTDGDEGDDDDDDMPPPVLPPRQLGNASDDAEDDDSSDDGEETQDMLDSPLGETPKATRSAHLNSMDCAGSPPSSHTLLIGSASQVSGSLNNKESTLLRGDEDGDEGAVVFF